MTNGSEKLIQTVEAIKQHFVTTLRALSIHDSDSHCKFTIFATFPCPYFSSSYLQGLGNLGLSLYSHVNDLSLNLCALCNLSACEKQSKAIHWQTDSNQDSELYIHKHISSLKVLVAMWVTGSLNFHDDRGEWQSLSISISVACRNSGYCPSDSWERATLQKPSC